MDPAEQTLITEGPKLTPKGRATRARIVQAAADLVFEQGVAGTSIPDVLKAAGVSASQLYHYFEDKDALIRAVIAHQSDELIEAQRPLIDALDSFEALRTWGDLLLDVQRQRHCRGGCPIGSLAGELVETNPEARADLVEGFGRWESKLRAGIQAMYDRGELRAEADPGQLALGLLAAVQGGLLLTQTRQEVTPLAAGLHAALGYIESFGVASR